MNLTKKYRLIWNIDSSIIQNDYETDYTGSITTIVNSGDLGVYEDDLFSGIEQTILDNSLIVDPSLN